MFDRSKKTQVGSLADSANRFVHTRSVGGFFVVDTNHHYSFRRKEGAWTRADRDLNFVY